MSEVEFRYQQVDDGHQIGDEHHTLGNAAVEIATEIRHRIEKVYASNRRDKAVDGDVLALVHQSGKLPDGESCHNAEQQHHRIRTQERRHDGCDEDDACNGSND